MRHAALALVGVLFGAGFLAWQQTPWLQSWVRSAAGIVDTSAIGPEAPITSLPASPTGVHKCQHGQQWVYSNLPCPPGQQAAPLRQGSVTVVKMPAAAPDAASSPANVRSLLGKPDEPNLVDRQIERATR